MSLLTAKQVAERIQLSRSVVSRLCSSGQLAHHRIGTSLRISEQDLEAFLARTRQGEPQHRLTPNAEVRAALAVVVGPGRKRAKKHNGVDDA